MPSSIYLVAEFILAKPLIQLINDFNNIGIHVQPKISEMATYMN